MDGKGVWTDINVVERFWCSLKVEEVYLRAYEMRVDPKRWISRYINTVNTIWAHASLGG